MVSFFHEEHFLKQYSKSRISQVFQNKMESYCYHFHQPYPHGERPLRTFLTFRLIAEIYKNIVANWIEQLWSVNAGDLPFFTSEQTPYC